MTDKQALRARLRAAREKVPPGPFPPPPAVVARLTPATIVASYVPMRGEADPALFDAAALAAGCRLALPHVTGRDAPLRFLAQSGEAALVAGPFGLQQPSHDAPELVPDIILTPLVGFDRRGNRLGQGAGYYDRAFAALPQAWRIGIAWSVQEVDALPADAWDVPLHAIATEREWIMVA